MEPTKPKFRYNLKAAIIGAGYKNLTDFSTSIEIDLARVSRIICGWEYPSVAFQKKTAKALGITLKELQALV